MKCTINRVRVIKLDGKRFGARIEGFIPMETSIIPANIKKWIFYYEGVKAIIYEDGIFVASWAETTCSDADTYHEEIGEHLAESKSKAKIYRFICNFSVYMANYFADLFNDFQDSHLKYEHCVIHEEAHKFNLEYNDKTRSQYNHR